MTARRNELTHAELEFWQRAFLAAELTVLLKRGRMNPVGAAHLAAEYATAAVIEMRNAKSGAQ